MGTKSDKVKTKSEHKPEEGKKASEEDEKKFIQGGSYADYFAKKLAALKAKGKFSSIPTNWTSAPSTVEEEEEGVQRIGFSGAQFVAPEQVEQTPDKYSEHPKKKKKSKKNKKEIRDEEYNINIPQTIVELSEKGEKKKKKKSKKQTEEVEPEPELPPLSLEAEAEAPKKKKSKKNKEVTEFKEDVMSVEEETVKEPKVDDAQKNFKKSKKKKREEEENQNVVEHVIDEEVKKKKSKKSKKEKIAQIVAEEEDSGLENEDTKNKKQKKLKKEKTKEKKTTYSDEEKENRKKRKSETEDEALSPVKKVKTAKDGDNQTKFEGFKGSNLLSIPGYGVNES